MFVNKPSKFLCKVRFKNKILVYCEFFLNPQITQRGGLWHSKNKPCDTNKSG